MMRRTRLLAATLVAVLATTLVLVAPGAPAQAISPTDKPGYFLVLGDGVAAGYQPPFGQNRTGGYPGMVLARIKAAQPNVTMVNLSCVGETTSTFINGGKCAYAEGSQLRAAKKFLRDHAGQVRFISLNVGGEDVHQCINLTQRTSDTLCAAGAALTIGANLPIIVGALRANALFSRIIVNTLYDPYVAATIGGGDAGRQQAAQSLLLFKTINAGIKTTAALSFAATADAFKMLDPDNFTIIDTILGPVAQNAWNVCSNTYGCQLRYNDISTNRAGNLLLSGVIGSKL
jgi:hypothetical protein